MSQILMEPPLRNPTSRRVFWPVVLALLFAAWRFCVFNYSHPYFLHDGDNYEELYRGTIAREVMLGTDLPIWDYRADDYAGGFYPVVTLLSLFFSLFGFSMLALKAFAISHQVLTLLAWFFLLQRFASRRAAVLFSLIYTTAPFAYIKLSSVVLGDHAETCVLSALSVLVFFRMLSMEGREKRIAGFTLGLVSGFGLWFAYIYGFTILAQAAYGWIHRKEAPGIKGAIPYFAAGFAIGFLPWLVFNFIKDFSGLIVYGVPVWNLLDWRFAASREGFFLYRLLDSEGFFARAFGLPQMLSVAYWIFFIGTLAVGGFIAKRMKLISWSQIFQGPKGLCLLYLLIYAAVQHVVAPAGFRFLIPLFPFAAVLLATLLAYFFQREWRPAKYLFITLGVLGISTSALHLETRLAGAYLSYKGYTVKILGYDPEALVRIEKALGENFLGLRPSDKTGYVIALARQLTLLEEIKPSDIVARRELVPRKFRTFYCFNVGRELLRLYQDPVLAVKVIEPLRASHPEVYEQAGRGIFSALSLIDDPNLNIPEIRKQLPPDMEYRTASYEGFQYAFKKLEENPDIEKFAGDLLKEIQNFDEDRRQRFVRGAGRQLFHRWVSHDAMNAFNPRDLEIYFAPVKESLFQGVAAQMLRKHLFLYGSPIGWNWREFFVALDPEGQKELVGGLKFVVERWGLPEEGIPFQKLKSIEAFW